MAEPSAVRKDALSQDASNGEAKPLSSLPCRSPESAPLLRLFHHHVYEYRRGVRALFLMTMSRRELALVLGKLEAQGIHQFVQDLSLTKVNLFFGQQAFVAVAQSIVTRPLNTLTPEEDFMLGTLLGYDAEQQCRRFLTRSGRGTADALPLAAE